MNILEIIGLSKILEPSKDIEPLNNVDKAVIGTLTIAFIFWVIS